MHLRLWGVRGSIPTPVTENLRYGGNTSCIEVRHGNLPPLIFDAGSGIRGLGQSFLSEFPRGGECVVFFTHFHWDHIQGLPFFVPLYRPDWKITFYAAQDAALTNSLLGGQMCEPYFPVRMPAVAADLDYREIGIGGLMLGDLSIRPFPLHHPSGATGFRIDSSAGSIVYATDHEHGDTVIDGNLIAVAAGADVLIYDAQYTPSEYASRHGWGHSTWEKAVRIAGSAGAKQLVLFHHDPLHNDDFLDTMVAAARSKFANCIGAQEGWSTVVDRSNAALQIRASGPIQR